MKKKKAIVYSGIGVRCVDCMKKKNCDKVRINKYVKKPCEDYDEDLVREAKLNEAAARRALG